MATLILQDTYFALEEEMKSINKLRADTALQIEEAASHGDLKENYDYKAAKEKMEFVIYKKQLLQSHAPFKLIDYGEIKTEDVGFGNLVKVLEEGKDETEDYYLLGPIESELDIYPLVMTYHAPFAKAMIGKKLNEEFKLEIGDKDIKFKIVGIEKITATTPKCPRRSL